MKRNGQIRFMMLTVAATVCLTCTPVAVAGITSEETFDNWGVGQLTFPDGHKVVALATTRRQDLTGLLINCELAKPIGMTAIGAGDHPITLKEMAQTVEVQAAVDSTIIPSHWRGNMIPVGFYITNDDAAPFIKHMNGEAVRFLVNGIKVSYSLKGFSQGLARFDQVCADLRGQL